MHRQLSALKSLSRRIGPAFRLELGLKGEQNFPKTCLACDTCYDDAGQFLAQTSQLGPRFAQIVDGAALVGRKCSCGHALALKCAVQRDESVDGKARRQLFDEIVAAYAEENPRRSPEAIRAALREIVRDLTDEADGLAEAA